MYYWVIQRIGGDIFMHGSYRTEQARDNRYEKVEGGEVYKFNSSTPDKEQTLMEFREQEVEEL